EALAAATDAYAKYLEVSDAIFQAGASQTDSLDLVMTGAYLESSLEAFRLAAGKGLKSTGTTKFDQVKLQQYNEVSNGEAVIVAYVCEDITDVDVVDANGNSLVSPDRPDRTLFEVTFDFDKTTQSLLISQRTPWSEEAC
ncbi:MAG: hypothetical protein ABIW32_01610, partial [Terrimesophilobacter sp.]